MSKIQRVLPDISRLRTVPQARWLEFGTRLRSIGFTDEYIGQLSQSIFPIGEVNPILIWHLRRRRESAAYAYRMLSMRDPVAEAEAADALGPTLVAELCDVGVLVRPELGRVVSVFDLRAIGGLIILCDDLANDGDVVFGLGPGTAAMCRAIPHRFASGDVLDLGCGAGTVALWAAKYARRVLATDINPRALVFAEINSAINGVSNVHTQESDLFESVSREPFDLITAHLPFVPDPGVATPTRYRFGGSRGHELALKVMSELPARLAADGRSVLVFFHPIGSAPDERKLDIDQRSAASMHTLLLLGPETDADAFSIRYAATERAREMDVFSSTAMQMREHLSNCGIRALCPAICFLQRSPVAQGGIQTVQVMGDLWRDVSASVIERLLASLELLRQPVTALLRTRLRIPEGTLIFAPFHDDGADRIYLAGPAGSLVRSLDVSRSEWALLQSVHRLPDVESALTLHQPDAREAELLTILRVLGAGFFDVQSETAGC